MAPSIRLNAIKRPPESQTAALTLMFISWALVIAAWMMRLASASVRAIGILLSGCVSDLLCRRAAVDDQLAARHESRFVRGEKEHAVGDILGRADTPHRQAPHALLQLSLVLQHILDHVRCDRPGMDGVTADAFLGVLDGGRL